MNNIKLQGINIDGIEKEYSLNDFKGQKVILYFYPKDNTSGCTQEACDFRDNINRLTSFATVRSSQFLILMDRLVMRESNLATSAIICLRTLSSSAMLRSWYSLAMASARRDIDV